MIRCIVNIGLNLLDWTTHLHPSPAPNGYCWIDEAKLGFIRPYGYGQLWPLRPACSHNWPRWYMPDSTSCIRFSSVFPKKEWIILCKTDPDLIWMAWSGSGQTHLVWKQAGVQESSGQVSGRTQPARYQFPTFRLGSFLPQTSQIICKTSPDLI